MANDLAPSSLQPWRVTSSTVTFQDRWLKVRTDDCVTAEGVVITPFHVIESRDWTAVVALTNDLRLVLVREYRHARASVIVGLPGGVIELMGDGISPESAELAARRELLEETGYGGGRFSPVLTVYPDPANQTNMAIAFLALDVERKGQQSLDCSEAIEVELADLPDTLLQLVSGGLRMHAVHVSALLSTVVYIMRNADTLCLPAELRDRLRDALIAE